jgi:GTP-binding protein HflX
LSVFNRAEQDDVARGARCLVVLPDLGGPDARDAQARLEEAAGLAMAIGVEVVDKRAYRIRQSRPASLFGQGQVSEMRAMVAGHAVELVVVDGALTPVQQSNLEKELQAKVIDRTGLILEIFGERAASAEGRLQVELAHLDYQAGRLVRSWTHLERQRGGFGFLGGPGETQIEADRRLIRNRMAKLRRELAEVSRTRGLHRGRRQRAPWPVVALVGYTNAGKSTLFNRMTGAGVMAENLLFATLDPTMRRVPLPGFDKAILSDTVGFVSNLPTQLVAAFKATLEEVISADLIIHVRDIAHPDSAAQAADVATVLQEIGATAPMIEVWNKLDLLDADNAHALETEAARRTDVAILSALTGDGLRGLVDLVCARLTTANRIRQVTLPATAGAEIAWLHANARVLHQATAPGGVTIEVRISEENWGRFGRRFGSTGVDTSEENGTIPGSKD